LLSESEAISALTILHSPIFILACITDEDDSSRAELITGGCPAQRNSNSRLSGFINDRCPPEKHSITIPARLQDPAPLPLVEFCLQNDEGSTILTKFISIGFPERINQRKSNNDGLPY
jgi:hypothetical protein